MDADYSVELGPTAPALEIPWNDPDGQVQYFNLHDTPSAIEQLPEARQFPALGRFLIALNSRDSTWQTAKCDVWADETEAAENLYNAEFLQSCYVDLVLARKAASLRDSLNVHEQLAGELAQLLEECDELEASAEIVIRRCYFHKDNQMQESDPGYCLTLFLTGYGESAVKAGNVWENALELAGRCILKLRPQEDRAQARELR